MGKLSKLRAMTAHEIAFRARERAYEQWERLAFRRDRLSRPDRLLAALTPELRRQSNWREELLRSRASRHVRFFPGPSAGQAIRSLFATKFQAEATLARRHAALAREHTFEFFGQRFSYGPDIDWHADPVSGRRWPDGYHGDVPVHRGDIGYGDVKFVWELGRHQFLIDLGKSYYLDGGDQDYQSAIALVRSWMAGNPYGRGVHWACALEPAFRAQSWLWAYHFFEERLRSDPDFHLEWLAGFGDHGHFLYRHLERYSSPYNHLTGEAATLYMLGVLFPEFEEATAWRLRGRRTLEACLEGQFHPDGGSVEQSTFYHHATLGFYTLAALLGRVNADEFGSDVWTAIEKGIDFSATMAQPDGLVPSIGGADDGKPIRLERLRFWDFRPYQAIGAVIFQRGDFKHAAGRFYEDALWLLGPDGFSQFEELPSTVPPDRSRALLRSGYFVLRSGWTEKDDYVCFDCGEQAAGARRDDIPSAMHGHADCLSVVAALGGRTILVDPGFYCYNGEPTWEVHFRKTQAHNTARVDQLDQAKHLFKMDWCRTFTPQIGKYDLNGPMPFVSGSHDGYARGPLPVVHRRTVILGQGGYFAVLDDFEGPGEHDIDITYQFAPGSARLMRDRVVFEGRYELAWTAPGIVEPTLTCGGEGPDSGWIALSLGVRQPAPRLDLRLRLSQGRTALLWVVADAQVVHPKSRVVRSDEQTGLLSVHGPGHIDLVLSPLAGSTGAVETDARLVVCRQTDSDLRPQVHVDGSYVRAPRGAAAPVETVRT